MSEKLKGLVLETSGRLFTCEFEKPLRVSVGRTIEGAIEVVHPFMLPRPYLMLVNENGHYLDLPINKIASYLYGYVNHGDFINGDVVIMKDGASHGEPDTMGLTDTDISYLQEWLTARYGDLILEATT